MATTHDKAVIDRIEDGRWAVLLVGQEQTEKIIPVEQLPQEAKEGTWLRLRLEEDRIQEIIVDAEETTAIRSRVSSKLDKLRSRQRRFQPVDAPDEKRAEIVRRVEPVEPAAPAEPAPPVAPPSPDTSTPSNFWEEGKFTDYEGYE